LSNEELDVSYKILLLILTKNNSIITFQRIWELFSNSTSQNQLKATSCWLITRAFSKWAL
jgi:hypothetical protein